MIDVWTAVLPPVDAEKNPNMYSFSNCLHVISFPALEDGACKNALAYCSTQYGYNKRNSLHTICQYECTERSRVKGTHTCLALAPERQCRARSVAVRHSEMPVTNIKCCQLLETFIPRRYSWRSSTVKLKATRPPAETQILQLLDLCDGDEVACVVWVLLKTSLRLTLLACP